jgi:hypothetical protein
MLLPEAYQDHPRIQGGVTRFRVHFASILAGLLQLRDAASGSCDAMRCGELWNLPLYERCSWV